MQILFSPILSNTDRILYTFEGEKIHAIYHNSTDIFDFTDFGEGVLELRDVETGDWLIETNLEYQPIREAKRKEGVLYVKLVNFIGFDATEEERFPDWIDHTEYIPPKVGEANGTDALEE